MTLAGRPEGLDPAERRDLLDRLRRDARAIAERFGLRFREIAAARADARSFYGLCDEDGRIRIRLNHVVTGRALRYSSLVSTLCHELAHLRHFHHGSEFRDFYQRLLSWAREQGIYRPRGAPAGSGRDEDPPLGGEDLRAALEAMRAMIAPVGRPVEEKEAPPPRQLSLFEDEA